MLDSGLTYQGPLYYSLIVVFGSFFLMNLILAAIMDSFQRVDKELSMEQFRKDFREVELKAH